ncbi:2-amino-4-hydroxy-6-hydroxymethyldihydropteridine diphosphokinase [Sulfurovum sp. ST-21]|uniref:2-amino-4-hydroxy-6-hydroxymethyldihydropteridine pyrophosphokinase n=1 Tax=Sulfurovum indicum TaxID=2779528 RepID=A0A7M1S5R5_9BACT|nr:2-amino-4-hydroxy-6-hydroxymethyldihydropteridine diphosphokinase [Sulfurovum indicum]QOR62775.1 2-amino-4-hydroxy-6-hydroxymethyldihydropteridine diphosphokinase [Sulfurovum indicum]
MVKRKKLNDTLTLIFTPHFPYNAKRNSRMRYRALLGIGGNIGDVVRRFEHLFVYLQHSRSVHLLETAPILKNPPFGFTEQEDFMNSLLLIETDMTPRELLHYVLHAEKRFGRKRLFKDGPRTLDIDLIFYEDITMESRELTLPHPGWMKRTSVLVPLSMMKKVI